MQPREESALAISLLTASQATILKSSQILSSKSRPERQVSTQFCVYCSMPGPLPFLAFLFDFHLKKKKKKESELQRLYKVLLEAHTVQGGGAGEVP